MPVRLFVLGEERVLNERGAVKNVVRRQEVKRRTTATWETEDQVEGKEQVMGRGKNPR